MIKKLFILAVLITLTSCSSNYMNNRILDARDIFSCSAGTGLGAQARVSYLASGLMYNKQLAGMHNGIAAVYGWESQCVDIEMALGRLHVFNPPYDVYIRNHGVLIGAGFGPVYLPRKEKWNPKWATQIDATVGLGISVKIGFNPGELADFILGWFKIDIYSDDYKAKEIRVKPPIKKKEQSKE